MLLSIGGTASNIKIRLLPKGCSPESTAGMVEGVFTVPKLRSVTVKLSNDRSQIIQISVNGGSKPWGNYSLRVENGSTTLDSVELIRP